MSIQIVRVTAERLREVENPTENMRRRAEFTAHVMGQIPHFFQTISKEIRTSDYEVLQKPIEWYSNLATVRVAIESGNGFMVAVQNKKIVGIRMFSPRPDGLLLSRFTIIPYEKEGNGIAMRLHRAMLSYGRTHGYRSVEMEAVSLSGKNHVAKYPFRAPKYRYTSAKKVLADKTDVTPTREHTLKATIDLFPKGEHAFNVVPKRPILQVWRRKVGHLLGRRRKTH